MAISVKETTSNKHRRDLAAVAVKYLALPCRSPDVVPDSESIRDLTASALTGSERSCSGSRAARGRVWQIRSGDRRATRARAPGAHVLMSTILSPGPWDFDPRRGTRKSGDVHIAYQISGAGPRDLVLAS